MQPRNLTDEEIKNKVREIKQYLADNFLKIVKTHPIIWELCHNSDILIFLFGAYNNFGFENHPFNLDNCFEKVLTHICILLLLTQMPKSQITLLTAALIREPYEAEIYCLQHYAYHQLFNFKMTLEDSIEITCIKFPNLTQESLKKQLLAFNLLELNPQNTNITLFKNKAMQAFLAARYIEKLYQSGHEDTFKLIIQQLAAGQNIHEVNQLSIYFICHKMRDQHTALQFIFDELISKQSTSLDPTTSINSLNHLIFLLTAWHETEFSLCLREEHCRAFLNLAKMIDENTLRIKLKPILDSMNYTLSRKTPPYSYFEKLINFLNHLKTVKEEKCTLFSTKPAVNKSSEEKSRHQSLRFSGN